jgi:VIT1/CCC1 family predicted Fe2+/Mn2+ transporter
MVVSITGSLSVATAGRQEVGEMLLTAVGCNLAWGLTDAVMYLIAAVTERNRQLATGKNLAGMLVPRATLHRRDLAAALGVFALVVLVTFPVVLPFLFLRDVRFAMRVSNGVALAILYGYGHTLGRYSGGTPWKFGLVIMCLGVVLVAIIMALGG